MIMSVQATVADLRRGDVIGQQWPEHGFPSIRGTVARVEPGATTGVWLTETGDMRWLLPADQPVTITRTQA